ncbi:MAG: DUF1275 domain-containing protein [Mycobacteriaceae bacterium]|nr:DUF1275 domain-containing protein [Mycobacteriaceae bacterium]
MNRQMFDSDARLSWVMAVLAGLLGATAFMHSDGYFVTFMTGNAQRAVLGYFRGDMWQSVAAGLLLMCFLAGVVVASWCRRHFWLVQPHGTTVLTTLCLVIATAIDVSIGHWSAAPVDFVPIMFVVFGVGAMNTSFVKDGEVSIPLSYVTGTIVKMGQGIERHISGGTAAEWLGYFLLFTSYVSGAAAGGFISLVVSGTQMIAIAAVMCSLMTGYTYFHAHRVAFVKLKAVHEGCSNPAQAD